MPEGAGPHEVLARDRRRYERLLLARMGTAISAEDAEDIVSEALIKAQIKMEQDPPRRGREGPWFSRIVLNLGVE
jgi:DNA-directed RNA polymerase specialized sigma24 family protein